MKDVRGAMAPVHLKHIAMLPDYNTNPHYRRVIPRDLFNESKLMKCIGNLILKIFDGNGLGMEFEHENTPFANSFKIALTSDGYLIITNISITLKNTQLVFRTLYNSKEPYPLFCTHNFEDFTVFEDNGEYTSEFITFCQTFKEGD